MNETSKCTCNKKKAKPEKKYESADSVESENWIKNKNVDAPSLSSNCVMPMYPLDAE